MAEDSSTELTETDLGGLRKIDDGSVVSNIHTSKWRVFTDNGRDLFLQARFLCANICNRAKCKKYLLSFICILHYNFIFSFSFCYNVVLSISFKV